MEKEEDEADEADGIVAGRAGLAGIDEMFRVELAPFSGAGVAA